MAKSERNEIDVGSEVNVKNLRVSYDSHEILHGIDFSIKQGEFVSIIGKSGSGKSTLLYALAGFVNCKGTVEVPNRLGVVFQNYAVFPWFTVRQNIALGIMVTQKKEKERLVDHYVNLIGLNNHGNHYPAQLSGGQQQRVALARALASEPELLLMDEPFGALDLYTKDEMQQWLLSVWETEHRTVLFVTHDIEEAIFLSDRIFILGEGVLLKEFEITFPRPRLEKIKFTSEFIELKKQIFNTLSS